MIHLAPKAIAIAATGLGAAALAEIASSPTLGTLLPGIGIGAAGSALIAIVVFVWRARGEVAKRDHADDDLGTKAARLEADLAEVREELRDIRRDVAVELKRKADAEALLRLEQRFDSFGEAQQQTRDQVTRMSAQLEAFVSTLTKAMDEQRRDLRALLERGAA